MNHEFPVIPADDILALATAMAERDVQITLGLQRINNELRGLEVEPRDEKDLRNAQVGRTVILLHRLTDPEEPVSLIDTAEADLAPGYYIDESAAISIEEIGYNVSPENLRDTNAEVVAKVEEVITPEQLSREFIEDMQGIEQVAKANNVSLLEVVEDDEMYQEAQRLSRTPEAYAEVMITALETITTELFGPIIARYMLRSLLTDEVFANMGEDLQNMLIAEELQETGVKDVLHAEIEMQKEVIRQGALHELTRIYGLGTLQNLPDSMRTVLYPKQPLAPSVVSLLKSLSSS